jgi:hypothetical protein
MQKILPAMLLVVSACSSASSPSPSPSPPTDAGDTSLNDASVPDSAVAPDAAEAGAADTWASFGRPFFAKYCIECHQAGNTRRDYTTLADVSRDKAPIRCGVSATKLPACTSPPPRQFPIDNAAGTNPKPEDAERARLIAWIDAGLAP